MPETIVGIIANPAAGKDIRRIVSQGRFISNQEKVNTITRVMAGLEAVGVQRVVFMPDIAMLGAAASAEATSNIPTHILDFTAFNEERDSTRAAAMMTEMGAGCLVTLGGDGTNRAVAKGCGDVPLLPISTGTNNVFPTMVEGTIAGLAAGIVAQGEIDLDTITAPSKALEVRVDGDFRDMALVDVAVSKERFVGARAIWNIDTLHEVYLARAEPASIGLSSIGSRLLPLDADINRGMYIRLGEGGEHVAAPIAPGYIKQVGIQEWRTVEIGESVPVGLLPSTIALDGERTFTLGQEAVAEVVLTMGGPRVVSIQKALAEASRQGLFRS
jgi:predicted polyphosphate/ATP-dependent NAD kinase